MSPASWPSRLQTRGQCAIGKRAAGQRKIQTHRTKQEGRPTSDDEPVSLAFCIMRSVDLVANLIGKDGLLRRERSFNGQSVCGHEEPEPFLEA